MARTFLAYVLACFDTYLHRLNQRAKQRLAWAETLQFLTGHFVRISGRWRARYTTVFQAGELTAGSGHRQRQNHGCAVSRQV